MTTHGPGPRSGDDTYDLIDDAAAAVGGSWGPADVTRDRSARRPSPGMTAGLL
jgi:hypothetical protein